MKIAMDCREALNPNPAGKGLWTKRVLEELQKRPDIHLIQYPSNKSQKTNNYQLTTNNLRWHLRIARTVLKLKPDAYLAPTSYIVPWLLGKKVPVAVVIHDLIAFDSEPHDRKAKFIERLTLPRVLQTARWIFTVSEATKEDLLTRFPKTDPKKITVVSAGPTINNGTIGQWNNERKLTTNNYQLTTRQKYILSIGTLCPRKNQLRLIQAFNALPDELKKTHRLILAGGRGWDDEDIVALAKNSENVEWRGYVPQEELTELLRNATLLAFPSLKEGFGFPVLDAMAMGVPMLTSNRSSMKEITGDAAMLVADPESVKDVTKAMQQALENVVLRETSIAQGKKQAENFSWEQTTRRMLQVIMNGKTNN